MPAGPSNLFLLGTNAPDSPASGQLLVRGSWLPLFVDDFGAGDGDVAKDSLAIQRAFDALQPGQELRFTPGKTYLISRQQLKSSGVFITPFVPAAAVACILNFRGATIKAQGAAFDVGGGGGGLGVINIVADDVQVLGGTIDCNNVAAYGIALKMWDGVNGRGTLINCAISNINEVDFSHSWTGISWSLGTNVPGATITATYHKEMGGILKRPQCPVIAATGGAIVAHADVVALIVGGDATDTGSTASCFVRSSSQWNVNNQKPDPRGILQFPVANERNANLLDLIVHDLGCNQIELYGTVGVKPQRPAWAAGIAVDANAGGDVLITATSNIAATVGVPSNLPNASDRDWRLRFVIFNNSGGALTTPVAFAGGAGGFKSSAGVSPANGSTIVVEFVYDQVRNFWIETARGAAV